jgi:hypothetical protein
MRRHALLLLAGFLLPLPLSAQAVRGVVLEQPGSAPVAGALVSLLDAAGKVRAEVLTDASGRYLLRAPSAGRYQLRADRVGYRSATSSPVELAAGATVEQTLRAPAEHVQLEALVATAGRRRCDVRPGEGAETATLWDEARKALRSTGQSGRQYPHRYEMRRTTREVDADTRTVRNEQTRMQSGYRVNPFASAPAEQLAERGYVQSRGDTLVFYGPDAAVLLSDAFLDTHCFRVQPASREHPGLVGLAFDAVAGRRLPEVQGVLWLDRRTAELRVLEYRYTNLPSERIAQLAEGRVEFRRLPDGAWIIPRWRIRMPTPREALPTSGAVVPGMERGLAGTAYTVVEEIGEVLEIRTASGEVVPTVAFAALAGVVYDSTRSRPLAGARVQLAGTQHAAVADAEGKFRIAQLPEGAYSLTFTHPRLDSLGFVPTPVRVALVPPQELRQELAIPGMGAILTAACLPPGSGSAALAGTVTSSTGGAPLPGVAVQAVWQRPGETGDSARVLAATDRDGVYRFCALPAGVALRVEARLADARTGAEVRLRGGAPEQRDFALAAAPPTVARVAMPSRVAGRMVDSLTMRPIAGAVLRFGRGLPDVTTDRRGGFALPAVPPGTYGVEFRHETYGTGTTRVTVREGVPAEFELRVPRRSVTLDPIVVTASRVRPDHYAQARRRTANVITREELDRRQGAARHLGDIVRTIPGLNVREIGYPGNPNALREVCIEPRGGTGGRALSAGAPALAEPPRTALAASMLPSDCAGATLILDDVPVRPAGEFLRDLALFDLESVEYIRPVDAASMYGDMGAYGVLVVYTRGSRRGIQP